MNEQARCPNCFTLINLPKLNDYKENGKIVRATPDVLCCGVYWRPIVPLFKTTECGIELRQLHPKETRRL